jgi:hypothetical protein
MIIAKNPTPEPQQQEGWWLSENNEEVEPWDNVDSPKQSPSHAKARRGSVRTLYSILEIVLEM